MHVWWNPRGECETKAKPVSVSWSLKLKWSWNTQQPTTDLPKIPMIDTPLSGLDPPCFPLPCLLLVVVLVHFSALWYCHLFNHFSPPFPPTLRKTPLPFRYQTLFQTKHFMAWKGKGADLHLRQWIMGYWWCQKWLKFKSGLYFWH